MLIVAMMVAIMKLLVLNFAMCVVNILGQCRLSACKKNNNCPNTVSSLRFGEIYIRWETFSSRGCSTLTESTEQRNDPVSQACKDYVQCQLDRLAGFLVWTFKMLVVLILNWPHIGNEKLILVLILQNFVASGLVAFCVWTKNKNNNGQSSHNDDGNKRDHEMPQLPQLALVMSLVWTLVISYKCSHHKIL